MKAINSDRLQLDRSRGLAAKYFCERYEREQRYLIIFSRDFSAYLNSADYLRTKDVDNQYYFDFLISFEDLKAKMAEFRWTAEKLMENGIDFKSIRKLYFAVA